MKKIYLIIAIFISVLLFYPSNKTVFAEEKDITTYNTTDYKEYNIISETEFYTVNTKTNKIEYFNNNHIISFGEYGDSEGQFTEINFFKKLNNGEFCILDSLNKLHFFDENFNFKKSIQYINYNNSFKPLGNITQIITDIYSNIYLIDTTNNFILKANSNNKHFEVINSSSSYKNTIITLLNNQNSIIYLQNKILKNENLQVELSESPNYIFSDALDYIYLVYNNKIEKYNSNLTLTDTKEVLVGSNYNINLENGLIYYILNNQITKIENFASNLENFTPPIDIKEKKGIDNQIVLVKPKNNLNLLKNPYSNTTLIKLTTNDILIKLSSTTNLTTNFAYVMFEKNNNYYIGFIDETLLINLQIDSSNEKLIPVRQDIKYYKYPTKNSNIIVELGTLDQKQEYLKTRIISLNNTDFVEINLNNEYIYVLEEEMILKDANYINLYLQTNAKLSLYNGENKISLYSTENKDNVIASLTKSQNVKVVKTTKSMSEIEIIINNKIERCYVENKYISNQNNFIIPITILLSIISLSVLLVLILKLKKHP